MNKFKNKKTQCLSNHLHDSKFEANYCNRLLAMQQKGEIVAYSIQECFVFNVNGREICRHFVDFYLVKPGGVCEAHEAKGYRTDVWKLKRELFRALFPDISYIVIQKKGWFKKWKAKRKMNKSLKRHLQRSKRS